MNAFQLLLGVEPHRRDLRVALNLGGAVGRLCVGLDPLMELLDEEAPEAVVPVGFVDCESVRRVQDIKMK